MNSCETRSEFIDSSNEKFRFHIRSCYNFHKASFLKCLVYGFVFNFVQLRMWSWEYEILYTKWRCYYRSGVIRVHCEFNLDLQKPRKGNYYTCRLVCENIMQASVGEITSFTVPTQAFSTAEICVPISFFCFQLLPGKDPKIFQAHTLFLWWCNFALHIGWVAVFGEAERVTDLYTEVCSVAEYGPGKTLQWQIFLFFNGNVFWEANESN